MLKVRIEIECNCRKSDVEVEGCGQNGLKDGYPTNCQPRRIKCVSEEIRVL